MPDIDPWELRSDIKDIIVSIRYFSLPGTLSGHSLNRMAGLPEDAEMPPEQFQA